MRRKLLALPVVLIFLSFFFVMTAPVAHASSVPRRLQALRWAEKQAGCWYTFGGTSCATGFDCSGLVMAAYLHGAGVSLPRTTYQMIASSKLVRIPASKRKRGDLAFYGSGHVELVTWGGTFGAQEPGTRVGWHHPSGWWHPTMYFRLK
jgi:cell wall-associated NlpC family hydrolase